MTAFLLDTHIALWLLGDPARVPEGVRATLADPANALLVSAASAMEVATKTRLGKLDALPVVMTWFARVAGIGADELAITSEHALFAGTMAWSHRDPFDRLLVAQAMTEGATLVTVDSVIREYHQVDVLTW